MMHVVILCQAWHVDLPASLNEIGMIGIFDKLTDICSILILEVFYVASSNLQKADLACFAICARAPCS